MKRLTALVMSLLLLLPAAALAWEEASTPLTVTLSYEPHRVLAVGTVHRSRTELDYDMLDENGDHYSVTVEYDELTHFKLDLPQGWLLCEGTSDGAFAAWRSPDGGIHAEFCYLTLPLDREWYFDAMLGRVVGGENCLDYRDAYCNTDLYPRLSDIGVRDYSAAVDTYSINRDQHVMYLAADQRTLVLYEYYLGFCLVLWADEGVELPNETLLVEIASTMECVPWGYYEAIGDAGE